MPFLKSWQRVLQSGAKSAATRYRAPSRRPADAGRTRITPSKPFGV